MVCMAINVCACPNPNAAVDIWFTSSNSYAPQARNLSVWISPVMTYNSPGSVECVRNFSPTVFAPQNHRILCSQTPPQARYVSASACRWVDHDPACVMFSNGWPCMRRCIPHSGLPLTRASHMTQLQVSIWRALYTGATSIYVFEARVIRFGGAK